MGKNPDDRIREFARRVKNEFDITEILLFGSRARGDNFNDSDYDVLIVSPDFKPMRYAQRVARMIDYWDNYPLEVEPLCYTPEEFEKKKQEIGIVQKAMLEGIEIS